MYLFANESITKKIHFEKMKMMKPDYLKMRLFNSNLFAYKLIETALVNYFALLS